MHTFQRISVRECTCVRQERGGGERESCAGRGADVVF